MGRASGRSRKTERRYWWMTGENAGSDVHWRCTRGHRRRSRWSGQPDDSDAVDSGEAGCRADRKSELAPPDVPRMRAYLREGPLVAHRCQDMRVGQARISGTLAASVTPLGDGGAQ